jgi:hypothetical protein
MAAGKVPENERMRVTGDGRGRRASTASRYRKFSAIRRDAWKDKLRARPPSAAIALR